MFDTTWWNNPVFLQKNSSQAWYLLCHPVRPCSVVSLSYAKVSPLNWFHVSFNTSFRIFYIHNAPFRTNKFLISVSHHIFPYGATAPTDPEPPHYFSFRITFRHTTFGRTPAYEWSARRRNLNLTTHNTQNRHTSPPQAGFELTIPGTSHRWDLLWHYSSLKCL